MGAGAEVEEAFEGATILAVVTGFVAAEVFEETGIVSEVAEGVGSLGGVFGGGEVSEFWSAGPGFVADDGAFEAPGAEAAPAGDGHAFDEVFFDVVGGLELGAEGFEDAGEAFVGFVGEDYGAGEEAVSASPFGCAVRFVGIRRTVAKPSFQGVTGG